MCLHGIITNSTGTGRQQTVKRTRDVVRTGATSKRTNKQDTQQQEKEHRHRQKEIRPGA